MDYLPIDCCNCFIKYIKLCDIVNIRLISRRYDQIIKHDYGLFVDYFECFECLVGATVIYPMYNISLFFSDPIPLFSKYKFEKCGWNVGWQNIDHTDFQKLCSHLGEQLCKNEWISIINLFIDEIDDVIYINGVVNINSLSKYYCRCYIYTSEDVNRGTSTSWTGEHWNEYSIKELFTSYMPSLYSFIRYKEEHPYMGYTTLLCKKDIANEKMWHDTVPQNCRTRSVFICLLDKYYFHAEAIIKDPSYARLLDEEICLDIIKKHPSHIVHIPNKFRTYNIAKCVLDLYMDDEYYIAHDDTDKTIAEETLNEGYQAYTLLRYYGLVQYGIIAITDLLPDNCFGIIYSYLQIPDLLKCKMINGRCYRYITNIMNITNIYSS